MSAIETRAAGPDTWDDVQHVFAGGGDGPGCQCAWPLLPNGEWKGADVAARAEILRGELAADGPAPALLAYVDGEAAGWVRVSPRQPQRRTVRSRVVTAGSVEPLDDPTVWAITCFSVRRDLRGQGLGARLLDAAVEHARTAGARVVEAYPIDTAARKASADALFVGTLSTFLAAGFTLVARPTPGRAVVSLTL